ncbi:type II toxin-antitoxin system HicB family antitoxin [Saccharomonospora iraqiensis]|uniref:type II toxin-antitoxin system HicB family antitoxin n=1 Tax=Saccharomonospora iraqiensis TaxID=52698 RepID=UPI00042868B8|nr:type II toxin-antitoxin system HicB family antitoxin [Saccharomonospora iraqiensis]
MSDYVILVERTGDGGYGAWAPDLPGCVALGDTYSEVVTAMADAVRLHLEGLREDGIAAPEPTTVGATTIAA